LSMFMIYLLILLYCDVTPERRSCPLIDYVSLRN
jgi:hypothetical protein